MLLIFCLLLYPQAAAEAAAKLDSGMLYPAEVGVNSYVRVRLSFCKKQVSSRIISYICLYMSKENYFTN